jgi:hypothetical protein
MADIISWDKAIDKKVKSSDKEDLGKVQSITKDYVQSKEGLVTKNYYFIPKYYIQGYDGDSLWLSLTKDEVKSRFEREKAPEVTEFETPDYIQRRDTIRSRYPDFTDNIPPYDISGSKTTTSSTTNADSRDTIPMPWDKIIDKKVKSSDKQDLGKVESVSTNYIEVKEGLVSKKHYYIPKYYIQGFDGDNLHTSLTKNEIKDRYEKDSPPSESEFQTQEYMEQKRRVDSTNPQFLHGIPWMAKESGVGLSSGYSATSSGGDDASAAAGGGGGSGETTLNIPWEEVIHKHVRTTDNVDIGDVERVGNEFIVVRQGVAKVRIYYIPKVYINNYDGSSLYIDVPSRLVSAKFERETEPTPEEIRELAKEEAGKGSSNS